MLIYGKGVPKKSTKFEPQSIIMIPQYFASVSLQFVNCSVQVLLQMHKLCVYFTLKLIEHNVEQYTAYQLHVSDLLFSWVRRASQKVSSQEMSYLVWNLHLNRDLPIQRSDTTLMKYWGGSGSNTGTKNFTTCSSWANLLKWKCGRNF